MTDIQTAIVEQWIMQGMSRDEAYSLFNEINEYLEGI